MKVYYGFKGFRKPAGGCVVTIGVFDGVHRGHQKVIRALVRAAGSAGRKSLVVTFDPHPLRVLRHKEHPPRLISLGHRLRLFENHGVDTVLVIRFTKRLSETKSKKFIKDMLIKKIGAGAIIAGSGFHLGRDRLKLEEAPSYVKTRVVPALKSNGNVVSSTWIRNLILRGDLRKAAALLGRPVSVLGTVTKGTRRGRTIGFPTANIDPHHEAIPPAGVYAVRVKIGKGPGRGRFHKGILNIGFRPTFHGTPRPGAEPVIEVHIVDMKKRILYGKTIEVEFVRRVRQERHFRHPEALKRQIERDVALARELLK